MFYAISATSDETTEKTSRNIVVSWIIIILIRFLKIHNRLKPIDI